MRVLKALPKDQLHYKPNARSPSAEQVVWTLAEELKLCVEMVREGKVYRKTLPPPPLDEMLEKYEQWSKELTEQVEKMDEAGWDRTAQFYFNGKLMLEQQTGAFLWFVLFDAIHHRGQLAAYLRPMGGKVPAIYGPSADEPSKM